MTSTASVPLLKFYQVRPALPAGVLGEAYCVTAVELAQSAPQATVEFALLLQRTQKKLITNSLMVPFGPLPAGLGTFGLEEAHEEAAHMARLALWDLLELRAQELGRPDIAQVIPELQLLQHRPFVGARVRGLWERELQELAQKARTNALKQHCSVIVEQIKPFVVLG